MRRRPLLLLGTFALAVSSVGAAAALHRRSEGRARSFAAVSAAALAQGDTAGAEAAARRAVESDPGVALGHLMLGRALLAGGRADEAAAVLRALADAPGPGRNPR